MNKIFFGLVHIGISQEFNYINTDVLVFPCMQTEKSSHFVKL